MSNPRRGYVAYLLRLWEVEEGESRLWRASLERPQSDEREGFASLADLFAFLENETQSSLTGSQDSDEEGK